MYPIKKPTQPKKESEGCEIEIKKTRTGKKIKISGKCPKETIELFKQENGID